MHTVLNWADSFSAGVGVVGGKGWNLSRLARYGFNVPPGGVLTTGAYATFIATPALAALLSQAEQAGPTPPDPLLEALHQAFMSLPLPTALADDIHAFLHTHDLLAHACAVRSSAVAEDSELASFAGVHHSSLNVTGVAAVLQAIRTCWASAWTKQAISYRHRMGKSAAEAKLAVVIMRMVDAVSAGVAFSCDPRNGREDQIYINANFGLGESVVNGQTPPDEFVVNHQRRGPDWVISERRIAHKTTHTQAQVGGGTHLATTAPAQADQASLPDTMVIQLAQFVMRIYDALGDSAQHQDIEWVYDGQQLHFVQARPVTTQRICQAVAIADQPICWSNGNYRDVLPMPQSMLTWTISQFPIHVILETPLRRTGVPFQQGVSRVRRYHGRGYFNLSLTQWEYFHYFAFKPSLINQAIGGHAPEITPPPISWQQRLRQIWYNLKLNKQRTRLHTRGDEADRGYIAYCDSIQATDWATVSDVALIQALQRICRDYLHWHPLHLMLAVSLGSYTMLNWLLEWRVPGHGTRLAQSLLIDNDNITSAEHGRQLARLAELARQEPEAIGCLKQAESAPFAWRQLPDNSPFKQALTDFLAEFGHRAVYELDIQRPRWREDPSWLLITILGMVEHPPLPTGRRHEARELAWQAIRQQVPRWLHPMIKRLVVKSGIEARQREASKSTLVRILSLTRTIALEAGKRLQRRGLIHQAEDVLHCSLEDLGHLMQGIWSGQGLTNLVQDRAERQQWQYMQPAPDCLEQDRPRHAQPQSRRANNGTVYQGLAVAAGRAGGKVRLLHSPDDGHRLAQGDVLVAPSTDPAWTPLFLRASALITETGGMVSHGAIVAREYGIPAVVNIPGIMQLLKDGAEVEVDGDSGLVICPD
ncbi:pyruvate,water dikinase [Chitinivorax tropicus]|uniref:Pyruvate,water dikinase n=1 Tax=Chitinivorax tropicus TaxID=714531 RepID=A0A840MPB8_9PROT|nr:PEP/pyruvate-binding domain-containing protein [Chitinivorax tropicus]MBB5019305.1 pyruvate,water dikinase [Chitinivorax tropicus]